MKIAIDATNIKTGGGLTHLKQIVENNTAENVHISLIGGNWIDKIQDKPFLKKMIFKKEFSLNKFEK